MRKSTIFQWFNPDCFGFLPEYFCFQIRQFCFSNLIDSVGHDVAQPPLGPARSASQSGGVAGPGDVVPGAAIGESDPFVRLDGHLDTFRAPLRYFP
jgi:hypothetical protein